MMSDLEPGKAGGPDKKPNQMLIRVGVWIVVGGIGLYLVISGIIGILAKG
jgi:hypothetical protein